MDVEITPTSSNSTTSFGYNKVRFWRTPLEYAVPFSIVSGSFCLIGGVTNLFVMVLLAKYTQMQQNMHFYIFSLCLSDFLYNVVFQPQVIWHQFTVESSTPLERSFLHGSGTMFLAAGCLSLFFVSFDKYLFVKYPLHYGTHMTKTKTKITVIFIWAVGGGLGVLVAFNITLGYSLFPGIVGLIFVSTIFTQILIFAIAKNQQNRIRNLARSLGHNHPNTNQDRSTASSRAIIRTKATKTIGLILAIYMSSWLPSTLYRIHYSLVGGDTVVYHQTVKIFNMLIQLHSCINPFIYIFRTTDVKLAIQNISRNYGIAHSCCCTFVASSVRSDDRVLGQSRNITIVISKNENSNSKGGTNNSNKNDNSSSSYN